MKSTALQNWKLYFDENDCVSLADLPSDWQEQAIEVVVPNVWERYRPGYDGIGWYHCELHFDRDDLEQIQRIRFGAVNYTAHVFLNGKKVGSHVGGYTPFVVDLSQAIKEGPNELVVRVNNPPVDREVDGLRTGHPLDQSMIPNWKCGWYYNFGGIWQEVCLESLQGMWIEDVFVIPEIDPKKIEVQVQVGGEPGHTEAIQFKVFEWKQSSELAICEQTLSSGGTCTFEIDLPEAKLWDLDAPHLYVLKAENEAGDTLGEWRFGLRSFTTDGQYFYLNGKRIILKGVLHQGLYPRTIAFPEDEATARKELELLKEAGGNCVRLHVKPSPPITIDLADEMGLLCIEEPPMAWNTYTDTFIERCKQEVRELIVRDRNHPSIVMWSLFNEVYHWRFLEGGDPIEMVQSCAEEAFKWDPYRLISDCSGGLRDKQGNHVPTGLWVKGAEKPYSLDDYHIYRGVPLQSAFYEEVKKTGEGKPNSIHYVSEFGTSGFPNLETMNALYTAEDKALALEDFVQNENYRKQLEGAFKYFKLADVYPDLDAFYEALSIDHCMFTADIMRALRANPHICGYVITQFADAASEFGGMLDLFRRPKPALKVFAKFNSADVATLYAANRVFFEGEALVLDAHVATESESGKPFCAELELLDHERTVASQKVEGQVSQVEPLELSPMQLNKAGHYQVQLTAEIANAQANDALSIQVLPRVDRKKYPFRVEDTSTGIYHYGPMPYTEKFNQLGYDARNNRNFVADTRMPTIIHSQGRDTCLNNFERLRFLRQEVSQGGVAIFIDSHIADCSYFFQDIRLQEMYGRASYAGNPSVIVNDAVTPRLDPKGSFGRSYAPIYPRIMLKAEDVINNGGELYTLHILPHQFGHPDDMQWGTSICSLPVGEGRVWICTMPLLDLVGESAIAETVFNNLLRVATEWIDPDKASPEYSAYRNIRKQKPTFLL